MEDDDDGVRYAGDAKGNSWRLPPPGLSAEQRLAFANQYAPRGRVPERPVTPDEIAEAIGKSPAEVARMKPEKKLSLANLAMEARRNKKS